MTTLKSLSVVIVSSVLLASCGGGGSTDNSVVDDPTSLPIDDPTNGGQEPGSNDSEQPFAELTPADKVGYRVTFENFWSAEDYPQEFPDSAHLSLVGGATHNVAVSFWEVGELATPGIEDMAESGLIDKLLFDEVIPAIDNGTADSMIAYREYTGPQIDNVPGVSTFDIDVNVDWPLVTMVTMLGPSPDWFVGVSGLSLLNDNSWETMLSVDLPLHDAGTKMDIIPVMGGPGSKPKVPIGLVAYDAATGVYLPTDTPQNLARLTFERIEIQ